MPIELSFAFDFFVVFIAYLIRGIAGFGSGLIAVPLLAIHLPLVIVVPLVVTLDYLASFSHGLTRQEKIQWGEILPLIPFSFLGIALSLYILKSSDTKILSVVLGIFIISFSIYQLLPMQLGRASKAVAIPLGFLGGFVGTLFGTGGAFYVIYLNLRHLKKNTFRENFAMLFLIDGSMRIIGYLTKDFYTPQLLTHLLLLIPVAGLGLYFGGKIHVTISKERFTRLISAILFGSGMVLISKV